MLYSTILLSVKKQKVDRAGIFDIMRNMSRKEYEQYPAPTGALLKWYDENRRILPWREDPAPYHIWLSEVMLQQTRVDTVISYYNRFLEQLPDIRALAEAEEEQLLKLWQGLGYYSRIRNMHKAARQVMEDCGGVLPSDPKELQKLSGIGPYAAAAIASIAYGVPVPSVDGNLLRVFARTTGYRESIRTPGAKKAAESHYRNLLPEDRPGDMNQALMDLGATICLPNGAPDCGRCPWSGFCEAFRTGEQESLPVKEEKKTRKVQKRTVFLIEAAPADPDTSSPGPAYALRKRPARGLLANLWEFPGTDGHLTEDDARQHLESLGFEVHSLTGLPSARHIFSHVEWDMRGYLVHAEAPAESAGLVYATKKEMEQLYSIPTAFRFYLSLLE